MKIKCSWGDLSKYRNELFGLSIIEIIIFHYFENYFSRGHNNNLITLIGKLYDYMLGDVGVEIFLFLSGMGLYFSLIRNDSVKRFYIRRFKRILPTFLIVSVMYYFWLNFVYRDTGILGFVRGEFFVNFFRIHDTTYWFILLILLMYLMFPYLYRFLLPLKNHRILRLLVLFGIWLGATITIFLLNRSVFYNIEILLFRIPIFILGLFFAYKVMENRNLSRFELLILILILAIKVIFIKSSVMPIRGRIMATLWTFPIMFIGVCVCKYSLAKTTKLNEFIQWTGTMSLELYIVHVSLREVFNAYNFSMSVGWHYAVMVIVAYCLAVILKKLSSIIKGI